MPQSYLFMCVCVSLSVCACVRVCVLLEEGVGVTGLNWQQTTQTSPDWRCHWVG